MLLIFKLDRIYTLRFTQDLVLLIFITNDCLNSKFIHFDFGIVDNQLLLSHIYLFLLNFDKLLAR